MQINDSLTSVIEGIGANKLRVVVDGPDRTSVENRAARELAQKEAAARGFSGGGLCETPQTGPVGGDGEMIEGEDALNPNVVIVGYRTEFTFAQRA